MGELCRDEACKMDPIKILHYMFGSSNTDDYEKYLVKIPGTRDYTPRLKKGKIGIVLYPAKFARSNIEDEVSPRCKRQVC